MTARARYLLLDTETTGLPKQRGRPVTDVDNWPRIVQLGWGVYDDSGEELELHAAIVRPEGFSIPADAVRIHGITAARAAREGTPLRELLPPLLAAASHADLLIAHNVEFDLTVLRAEMIRLRLPDSLRTARVYCTMVGSTEFCAIPGAYGPKYPRLPELHTKLFGTPVQEAHEVGADIRLCAKCFFELRRRALTPS
jgi:DNA polymerase III epsilon subunit-like protein